MKLVPGELHYGIEDGLRQ